MALDRTGAVLHTWETRDAPRLHAVRDALRTAHSAASSLRAAHATRSTVEWRVPLQDDAHLNRVVHALWKRAGGSHTDPSTATHGMSWACDAWHHVQTATYTMYDGREVQQTTQLFAPTARHLSAAAAAARDADVQRTLLTAAQVLRACSAPSDTLHAQQAVLQWLGAHPTVAKSLLSLPPNGTPPHTPRADGAAAQRGRMYNPTRTRVEERVVLEHPGAAALASAHACPALQTQHVVTRAVDAAALPSIVLPSACTMQQRLHVRVAWDGAALRRWTVHVQREASGGSMHAVDAAFHAGECRYALVLQLAIGAAEEPTDHNVQMALRVLRHATNLARRTSDSDVA